MLQAHKKMWACCSNTRYVVKRHVKIDRDTTKQLVNVRDSYVRDAAAQKVHRIIAAVRFTKCLLFFSPGRGTYDHESQLNAKYSSRT